VFRWAIVRFDLKTPGAMVPTASAGAPVLAGERGRLALGGAANLVEVGACTTRLRLVVADQAVVDEAALRGGQGPDPPSPRALQVVLGRRQIRWRWKSARRWALRRQCRPPPLPESPPQPSPGPSIPLPCPLHWRRPWRHRGAGGQPDRAWPPAAARRNRGGRNRARALGARGVVATAAGPHVLFAEDLLGAWCLSR
jgi:PTS system N-acetylglucosamine-specific IIC component